MPQYNGVWTLEAQAQAQSNQQWVTDPNFKNTTLLLQADGTGSGSQNQTFLDGSTNNFFITRNGNTTQGSFSPFSQAPGYWSNFFNSTANYLTVPYNSNFLWSTGARTYEAFVYVTSVAANNAIFGLTNLSSSNTWELYINTSSQVVFRYFAGGVQTVTTTTTVPLNTWAHVAFVYDGTSAITIYINGVSAGTGTITGTPVTDNNQLCIGRTDVGSAGNVTLSGYISNARFTSAVVYTGAFTPQTTPLTAITNTSLLTCQSNRFVDNSASPATITANGTVSVQAFGPFAPALQWTPDVVGGSGYFDGSDYLSLAPGAAFAFGTSDFTVETWYYPTSTPTDDYIIEARNSSQTNTWTLNFAYSGTNGQLNWGYNGTTLIAATTNDTVKPYIWSHIAYTRTGTTGSLYVNGVRVGTGTDNTNYTVSPTTSYIGCRFSQQNFADGYFSGMRVVNGTALYTGASYTVPTTPPTAVANTSLLLNYTNAGIYDGKMGNVLETVGTAQVATSPVKFGSGSMYFGGTGTYPSYATSNLVGPANAGFYNFGTSNFTIEAWINLSVTTTGRVIVSSGYNADTGAGGWTFTYRGDISSLSLSVNANVVYSKSWSPSANIWYHVAVTRAENILRFFVDGVQIGTTSTSTDNITGSSTIVVGGNSGGTNLNFFGYIDDLRITRVARYIANFTPPQQALPRQ
jgi:hypothetical protein